MNQLAQKLQSAMHSLQTKNYLKCDALCSDILNSEPNQADALHLLALSNKQQAKLEHADTYFKKSLSAKPGQPVVLSNYANLLSQTGRADEAEKMYGKSIKMQPDNIETIYNLASLLHQTKQYKKSIERLKSGLKITPQHPHLYNLLGTCYKDLEYFEKAIKTFEEGLKFTQDDFYLTYNLGSTFRKMQQPQKALDCFSKIKSKGQQIPEYLFNLGCVYYELGKQESAEKYLKLAIEINPEYVEAHDTLNKLYWENSKESYFTQSFVSSLKKLPSSETLWYAYAANLMLAKRNQQAEEVLLSAMSTIGKRATFLHALGTLKFQNKDYEDANQLLKQSVDLDPDNIRYQIDVANLLIRQEDYKTALKHLEHAHKVGPLNQEVWAYKGICWRLLNDERYHWLTNFDLFVDAEILTPPPHYDNLEHFLTELRRELVELHISTQQPLDQSVQGGTQTIGNLLLNPSNAIKDYKNALWQRIERFLNRLPEDPTHPFLNRNTRKFAISGSWSVSLTTGGFHTNHVHPDGWLSGPTYVTVPSTMSAKDPQKSGWVKFGETSLELGERENIGKELCPQEGLSVLFPSYMWHGTYPLQSDDKRMTAPCDISPIS